MEVISTDSYDEEKPFKKELITDFLSKEELLINKLIGFYSNPKNLAVFINIVEQGTVISLRLLDWFSTNYSKFNRVYINKIDIHSDYKDQLKGYKKQFFDPFCRRQRIFLMADNIRVSDDTPKELTYKHIENHEEYLGKQDGIVTTVGQLNFFKWCIERNIVGYILSNLKSIENSMFEVTNNKKNTKEPNYIYKTVMQVTLKFN